jgi:7-cyano-7-deazaguanine synthase
VCELDAAARVARALGAREQRVVSVDLRALGGSALTDELAVPKDRAGHEIGRGVPTTYVPARNTVFLAIALGYAEVVGARAIFLGINAIDYSGYPDCRPEFLAAFQKLAQLATAAGAERGESLELHAPLVLLSKREIVLRGRELGVDFALTHSCYDPHLRGERWLSCGRCDACQLRLEGFRAAGLVDPLEYA